MRNALFPLLFATSALAWADVTIKDAWIRPTVASQKVTAAYLEIVADSDSRLIAVSTPIAGTTQIHEMKMDGEVMRMRELKGGLYLPARQSVLLKPGGNHLMLLDLTQAVKTGDPVVLRLEIEESGGKRASIEVTAVARPPVANASGHGHHH